MRISLPWDPKCKAIQEECPVTRRVAQPAVRMQQEARLRFLKETHCDDCLYTNESIFILMAVLKIPTLLLCSPFRVMVTINNCGYNHRVMEFPPVPSSPVLSTLTTSLPCSLSTGVFTLSFQRERAIPQRLLTPPKLHTSLHLIPPLPSCFWLAWPQPGMSPIYSYWSVM